MHRLVPVTLVLLLPSACHRAEITPPAAHEAVDAAVTAAIPLDTADPSSLSRAPESLGEIAPALTVASGGETAIAWTSRRGSKPGMIGVRVSRDGGATWETTRTITSPDDRGASDPALAHDAAGNLYVAWRGARFGDGGADDTHIYVSRAEARGGAFAAPVEISDPARRGTAFDRPSIAVTGSGNVLITWAFSGPNGDGIGIAVSTDGLKWTKGVVIERIDLHTRSPYICTSPHGERAWVAYFDSEAGIRVRASDDGGSTWSPSRVATVSLPEERARVSQESAVCVGEGEEVTIAYSRARAATDGGAPLAASAIVVARSADGGRSFDARKAYDAGALAVLYPQMAREPDGSLDVAFYASGATRDSGSLRWFRAADEKGWLSASKVISDHLRFEPSPSEGAWPGSTFGWAWHDGSLEAASVDNSGETPHVVFARVPSR